MQTDSKKNPTDDDMLTYEGAARLTGMKVSTLYSKVARKEVPYYRLGKRLVVFSREELSDWMLRRKVEVQP